MKNEALLSSIKRELLKLSFKGMGTTAPNPCVAAVLTVDEQIVAGAHTKPRGGLHAERALLKKSARELTNNEIKRSRLWVSLEPCCHFGKNPPCTDIILETGIPEVHYIFKDPNPQVAGQGIKRLRQMGVKVIAETKWQNDFAPLLGHFLKAVQTKRPGLWFKAATTIDGYMADSFGNSKWITNAHSRMVGHRLRYKSDGILVGAGTFFADKPNLLSRQLVSSTKSKTDILYGEPWHQELLLEWNQKNAQDIGQPQRFVVFNRLGDGVKRPAFKALEPLSIPVYFILLGSESAAAKQKWWCETVPKKFHGNFVSFSEKKNSGVYDMGLVAQSVGGLYAIAIQSDKPSKTVYTRMLRAIYSLGNHRILIEGGAKTMAYMLPLVEKGDMLFHFQAPSLLAGRGHAMFSNPNVFPHIQNKLELERTLLSRLGSDTLSGYRFK